MHPTSSSFWRAAAGATQMQFSQPWRSQRAGGGGGVFFWGGGRMSLFGGEGGGP